MVKKLTVLLLGLSIIIIAGLIYFQEDNPSGTRDDPFPYNADTEQAIGRLPNSELSVSRLFRGNSEDVAEGNHLATIVLTNECYIEDCNYRLSDFYLITADDIIYEHDMSGERLEIFTDDIIADIGIIFFILPEHVVSDDLLFVYDNKTSRYFFELK